MKKESLYFLFVLPLFSFSQKIFTTDYPSQSDIKVFVVDKFGDLYGDHHGFN